ncbi:NAD(P)-dependent oxidoreductase [Planococcus shenhongbingii]|uniref:NAD(P)-dependent oxidoreductase n=1 Tax=Planococcus shenhongbingii TaxID=3058398 RepID=A0ABT8N8Y3_9BACL|nr:MULTISPECIES: NAD(P)-dependent oxidoreductase [unclassified Planococcus (in: firmicutes)]MDN7244353.1 NAD(P)-dependent oxidoreductase [Planococcus sp. N017]WKA57520.1 NAD(P)-dependent oxidoreductase [Planococcus sp. N016]
MKLGFIGTGVMGNSLVKHLLKAGHEVTIYTRTAKKAENLVAAGAKLVESPKQVAEVAETLFTMVGYPSDVEEIYFGEQGILKHAQQNTVLIDLTTSQPNLAKRIFEEAKQKGIKALDAPVSGGDLGAQKGTLSIMVGGDEEAFQEVLPLLELMGENIVYQGTAGSGQHTKMCNQINIASNMIGVCESLVYAKKAGLDPEQVLKSISSGAAGSWSLSNLAPRMIAEDFAPGFYIKHFIKDMKIAAEEAELMGLDLPGLRLSLRMYEKLADEGYSENGTQALIKHFE